MGAQGRRWDGEGSPMSFMVGSLGLRREEAKKPEELSDCHLSLVGLFSVLCGGVTPLSLCAFSKVIHNNSSMSVVVWMSKEYWSQWWGLKVQLC